MPTIMPFEPDTQAKHPNDNRNQETSLALPYTQNERETSIAIIRWSLELRTKRRFPGGQSPPYSFRPPG